MLLSTCRDARYACRRDRRQDARAHSTFASASISPRSSIATAPSRSVSRRRTSAESRTRTVPFGIRTCQRQACAHRYTSWAKSPTERRRARTVCADTGCVCRPTVRRRRSLSSAHRSEPCGVANNVEGSANARPGENVSGEDVSGETGGIPTVEGAVAGIGSLV